MKDARALAAATRSAALFAILCVTSVACSGPGQPGAISVEQGSIALRTPDTSGVRSYLGIPYAAPPTGEWRWRPPRPPTPWEGSRSADRFGDRCIQTNPFPDMLFQSVDESEDCLTLSIWTKGTSDGVLPVMVWIHGGGHFSGASDEKRHDGTALARKNVVVVAINYRLGVLGFLAHPALSAESEVGASGNYGLLDQIAALRWVRDNIAGFGGDPNNVTIFGESAGSFSVNALMASPLAEGLFHKAIGQSGAYMGMNPEQSLEAAEHEGEEFAAELGVTSLAELRALGPEQLAPDSSQRSLGFSPIVDGYVLTSSVRDVFERGEQARVPLLAGWTSTEIPLPRAAAEGLDEMLRRSFPHDHRAAAEVYSGGTDREAWLSAVALSSDRFVAFDTWKWIELHAAAGLPTYRYLFDQVRPDPDGPPPDDAPGAPHASEIEYVFGTLDSRDAAWSAEDRMVAEMMMDAWTSFAQTGEPTAPGLPDWPEWQPGDGRLMRFNASPALERDANLARYRFLDSVIARRRGTSGS